MFVYTHTLHSHNDQYVNILKACTKILANRELRHCPNQYGRNALFPPYLFRHRPRRLELRPYILTSMTKVLYMYFTKNEHISLGSIIVVHVHLERGACVPYLMAETEMHC